jgi:hypothetical protein
MEEKILTKENTNDYGKVRKSVLEFWLKETNRKRAIDIFDDDFSDSLICKWQNEWKNGHVSVFCSIGEWSSNITDVLCENRYDQLNYIDNSEALFRLYTRFLMVVSELIEDLQHINAIIKEINPKDKSKAGNDFEKQIFDVGELKNISDFINKICKHKITYLHKHNHHLQIVFKDALVDENENFKHNKIISLSNLVDEVNDEYWIEIPKLAYLIGVIIRCFNKIDTVFNEDEEKLQKNMFNIST